MNTSDVTQRDTYDVTNTPDSSGVMQSFITGDVTRRVDTDDVTQRLNSSDVREDPGNL